MIQVSHLTKRYGRRTALDDLTFTVQEGCIYGLLGPNGAGKSTTMNLLAGCLAPTAGSIRINGFDTLTQGRQARGCVGYLPEQPPLYPDMTAAEYLHFVAELKGVKKADRADEVSRAARQAGLTEVLPRLLKNLSKGYRQRVGVAQALLGQPPVIILDEPTVGLDPAQVREMRRLIRALGKKHTVILSSHILSEVQAVCDQVLILDAGKLVAVGAPQELAGKLQGEPVLRVTALGSGAAVLSAVQAVEGVRSASLAEEKNGEATVTAICAPGQDLRAAVSGALAAAGCAVLALAAEAPDLEQIFLQLTAEAEARAAAEEAGEDDEAEEEDPENGGDTPGAEDRNAVPGEAAMADESGAETAGLPAISPAADAAPDETAGANEPGREKSGAVTVAAPAPGSDEKSAEAAEVPAGEETAGETETAADTEPADDTQNTGADEPGAESRNAAPAETAIADGPNAEKTENSAATGELPAPVATDAPDAQTTSAGGGEKTTRPVQGEETEG